MQNLSREGEEPPHSNSGEGLDIDCASGGCDVTCGAPPPTNSEFACERLELGCAAATAASPCSLACLNNKQGTGPAGSGLNDTSCKNAVAQGYVLASCAAPATTCNSDGPRVEAMVRAPK